MKRSEAEALGMEALELATEGQWPQLIEMELPPDVLELVRQKEQINKQITLLEEQEEILWELMIQLLTKDS